MEEIETCDSCSKEVSLIQPFDQWLFTLLLGNWMIFDGKFICAKCRGRWNGSKWVV